MIESFWYVLNNVGRKAVFIETGAITAHWRAEVKLGYALKKPMIDRASEALDDAIASRVIDNISEKDSAPEDEGESIVVDGENTDTDKKSK